MKKTLKFKNKFHLKGLKNVAECNSSDLSEGDEDELRIKKWFEEFECSHYEPECNMRFEELEALKKEGKLALDKLIAHSAGKQPKTISNSDYLWLKMVMSKGTKTDKIAAYIVLIQDSPLCNLHLLNNIISLVKVGKKEWILAADTLQELFLNDLLPPNRKLFLFSQRPLKELETICHKNEAMRQNLLMYWFFENQLKLAYRDFVEALNQISQDSVESNKGKAITIMFKLLENIPEQESVLLSNIVNKLGDPGYKIGSKVIYILTKLLQIHPNMREVVLEEVEKLIFRPNISKRAQYYSICFLAQFCLTNNDSKLSKKLIHIYLSIFKACVKKGDVDSRIMSALLTGVNRAYPFANEDANVLWDHINTLYKVVHIGKPSISIQALSLLYLMSGRSNAVADRFFTVLYRKISQPSFLSSAHQAMVLNLIYKALRNDESSNRVVTFLKRLLQVSAYLSVPIVCGILLLISEILWHKKINALLEHTAEDTLASKKFDDGDEEDDNGCEHYEDVLLESDMTKVPVGRKSTQVSIKNSDKHIEVDETSKVWRNPYISRDEKNKFVEGYDPYHRNPLYGGGNESVFAELNKLSAHYHPSVSVLATKIINGEKISYGGDPLQDFALIRFLDKFSFKNPRAIKSVNSEKETFYKFGKRKLYNQITLRQFKCGSDAYGQLEEENVPADERFLHSYLKAQQFGLNGKEDEGDSDMDSVASDEFEELINKMSGFGNEDEIDFLNEAGHLPNDEESDKEEDASSKDDGSESLSAQDFEGDEMDDFSDELMEGSELDEDEIPEALKALGKKNQNKLSRTNLFASAEEFSELLEQSDYLSYGSEAVSNMDNAGQKQLRWEKNRSNLFFGSRNFRKTKRKEDAHPALKRRKKM